jgi:subtilisin-like proprotein convertase family protein
MERDRVRSALWGAALVGMLQSLPVAPAGAADQLLELKNGWNLVSVSVQPENSAVQAVLQPLGATFIALWAYDAEGQRWETYPPVPGVPRIEQILPGRGYWMKVSATGVLTIKEAAAGGGARLPSGSVALSPGWNLVGFPVDQPTDFAKIFKGAPLAQLWRFETAPPRFVGFELASGEPVGEPAFTEIEPGRGYWAFLKGGNVTILAPLLDTALPGDVDVPPLLGIAAGTRPPFSPLTPGDIDIGGDGFYDRPNFQRAIEFTDNSDLRTLLISNAGSGVLKWAVGIRDPEAHEWLRVRGPNGDLVSSASGTATTESDSVDLVVDRGGLPPGTYDAFVDVTSNGDDAPFPTEATRQIPVRLVVPDLAGDYELRVKIDRVNGNTADLPNPRIALSLYRDGSPSDPSDDDRLKAIIDADRTLLFPQNVRLAGHVYQAASSKFVLSGSFELPTGPGNPYAAPVRRDITLVGDRRAGRPVDPEEALIGPLDLKGQYFETIRNVIGQPIVLEGTFFGYRKGGQPVAVDIAPDRRNDNDFVIPSTGVINSEITVNDRLLLTEVDVLVRITHTRPSDLRVTLISPTGAQAVLRDRIDGYTGDVTYDETAPPSQPLSVFTGTLSRLPENGKWTLKVEDLVAGESGVLENWELFLKGTKVSSISGRVQGVGKGATVLLSGCGVVATATTDDMGAYSFTNLVDCVYQITVHRSGKQRQSTERVLAGSDLTGVDLNPGDAAPDPGSAVTSPPLPGGGGLRLASLTTWSSAGATQPRRELIYVRDSATFDVDRPKVGEVSGVDTTEFSGDLSTLTKSNVPNCEGRNGQTCPANAEFLSDGRIDAPVGVNSRRAFMSIGGPVLGQAVSGNLRIQIGPNP